MDLKHIYNKLFKQEFFCIPKGDILQDRILADNLAWSKFWDNYQTCYIGNDTNGSPIFIDLETAPHILIAGSTGSGKSVCINTILLSLLLKNSPNTLKLHIIDPKRVDYSEYKKLPHTQSYSVTIPEAVGKLESLRNTMYSRYDLLEKSRCKKISELDKPPARLLVVFDEFASICNSEAKKQAVPILQDLARLGRAAGIHLILATQRPDRTIIDGQLKANCPTRIGFKLPSTTDSRVILDQKGCESLAGSGAGIVLDSFGNKNIFQGYMIDNDQSRAILDCWNGQPVYR